VAVGTGPPPDVPIAGVGNGISVAGGSVLVAVAVADAVA
jgi:hypothetical protein